MLPPMRESAASLPATLLKVATACIAATLASGSVAPAFCMAAENDVPAGSATPPAPGSPGPIGSSRAKISESPTTARGGWTFDLVDWASRAQPPNATAVFRGAHGETRTAVRTALPSRIEAPLVIPDASELQIGFALSVAPFMVQSPELAEPTRLRIQFQPDGAGSAADTAGTQIFGGGGVSPRTMAAGSPAIPCSVGALRSPTTSSAGMWLVPIAGAPHAASIKQSIGWESGAW